MLLTVKRSIDYILLIATQFDSHNANQIKKKNIKNKHNNIL